MVDAATHLQHHALVEVIALPLEVVDDRFEGGGEAVVASSLGAQAPSAPTGGGRGGANAPPEPTPRLADGTVNLGRVLGEKGVWNVPYITNMGVRLVGPDGERIVEPAPAGGRRGTPVAPGSNQTLGQPLGGLADGFEVALQVG